MSDTAYLDRCARDVHNLARSAPDFPTSIEALTAWLVGFRGAALEALEREVASLDKALTFAQVTRDEAEAKLAAARAHNTVLRQRLADQNKAYVTRLTELAAEVDALLEGGDDA